MERERERERERESIINGGLGLVRVLAAVLNKHWHNKFFWVLNPDAGQWGQGSGPISLA